MHILECGLPPAADTEGSYTSSDEVAEHQVWPQQSVRHTSLGGGESEEEGPERRTFPKLEQVGGASAEVWSGYTCISLYYAVSLCSKSGGRLIAKYSGEIL